MSSQQQGTLLIKKFKLQHGESINNLKLHYITLGKAQYNIKGEITNAVMLLHATINDATSFLEPAMADILFSPEAPFDLNRFYIVIPDGIGAGKSSKPSDGLFGQFPQFGYLDQIAAHKAVLDKLGIHHLKVVLGTSMGGMQTWLWGEIYPDTADVLIPIVSAPMPVCGRNFIWREAVIKSILNDPHWQSGNYTVGNAPFLWRETVGPMNAIMLSTPEMLRGKSDTRDAAIAEYHHLVQSIQNVDASDLLYIFKSSFDYNPTPYLTNIKAQVLAINFQDDLINPPELLHIPSKANIHSVMLPGGYGHLTFAHADRWVDSVKECLVNR